MRTQAGGARLRINGYPVSRLGTNPRTRIDQTRAARAHERGPQARHDQPPGQGYVLPDDVCAHSFADLAPSSARERR